MSYRKISKARRELAANMLAIAASNYPDTSTWDLERVLLDHEYTPSGELAREALNAVAVRFDGAEAYAEAEAMLRCGWSP